MYDAVVLGGGFYGVVIADYLVTRRALKRVLLIEREDALLSRASFHNQARAHNGYHYPRSLTTAYRSRLNLPRFERDFGFALRRLTSLYGIARHYSKVTAPQFERFVLQIGAPLEIARPEFQTLFSRQLIEEVFEVDEPVFDAEALRVWACRQVHRHGIEVALRTHAQRITHASDCGGLRVSCLKFDGEPRTVEARAVFNCAYSGVNQLGGDIAALRTQLRHEITELALLAVPEHLSGVAITIMDGPFFSLTPFPPRGVHALSHVRYTPHEEFMDRAGLAPYEQLAAHRKITHVDRMVRDCARYLPCLTAARYEGSFFEVKTTLVKNEQDDGRPILFERDPTLPTVYTILGSKLDNVYDVLEKLDSVSL